jgi:hypothetical protein
MSWSVFRGQPWSGAHVYREKLLVFEHFNIRRSPLFASAACTRPVAMSALKVVGITQGRNSFMTKAVLRSVLVQSFERIKAAAEPVAMLENFAADRPSMSERMAAGKAL